MTSKPDAYVWVFPPRTAEPVVAGAVFASRHSAGLAFQYSARYLAGGGLALGPDMPLERGAVYSPIPSLGMPYTLRDAMPDTWGRQVINRELNHDIDDPLPDIRYMLESGSDRVGAIDFQSSATEYVPRFGGGTLRALSQTAAAIDEGDPVGAELFRGVRNSLTAAGGSQPKAFVSLGGASWLAKFSTPYDRQSPLIKAERAAMYVAQRAGLDVPEARLLNIGGNQDVLLSRRFDRDGAHRRMVLSGNTVSGYAGASGGSYPLLVEKLQGMSPEPASVGRELFRRLAFRMAMRIDDDHLRNVALFWGGKCATFTPAFDLSPDLTATPTGLTDIGDGSREFTLSALVARSHHYSLSTPAARAIAQEMTEAVIDYREEAADVARMTSAEKHLLLTRTATAEITGATQSARPQRRRGHAGLGRTENGGNSGSFATHERSEPEVRLPRT